MEVLNTIGRRKTSVARVYIKKGSGSITINRRDYKAYFPIGILQYKITQPFVLANLKHTDYDIKVNVEGGGVNGQAEAVRLGIARALVSTSEEYRKPFRDHGLLTRDPRMVERKKFGRKKARKRFQFSKR
jgi:small subunit ribosomal protein S9